MSTSSSLDGPSTRNSPEETPLLVLVRMPPASGVNGGLHDLPAPLSKPAAVPVTFFAHELTGRTHLMDDKGQDMQQECANNAPTV